MKEHFYQCPYCWEDVSILIDLSQSVQNYIEDCEVCCNPTDFNINILDQTLTSFEVRSIEQ